jgi:prepilin-type N-terminal cleavage/methylation domain-containing protein
VRHGTTLPELLLVLIVVGVLGSIAVVRVSALRDRMGVRSATAETVATFAAARRWAVTRATRTAVSIDTAGGSLTVRSYGDTVAHRLLARSHGVTLVATRDSMAYAPNGLGYGASNLSIIIRRGTVADTIAVSRLGRVRR